MSDQILVARMDGSPEAGFAPGAITPCADVPVTRNFDRATHPIGIAQVSIDGTNVYATLRLREPRPTGPLYPAVGGRGNVRDGGLITQFDLIEVSLCDQPNVDPSIPPVSL